MHSLKIREKVGIVPTTLFRLPDGQEDNGKIRSKFSKWENPPQSPEWRSLHVSHWCLKKLSKKTITTSSAISSLATLSIFASVPFHPKSTLVLPCLASLFTGMCCMYIKNLRNFTLCMHAVAGTCAGEEMTVEWKATKVT